MFVEQTETQPQVVVEAPAAVVAPVAAAPADTGKTGPAKPWMAQLKKELQDNTVLSQYEDFSSVAQRVVEFEAKKDRLLEIPAADAPEDVKKQFRSKLGVPAKPEDYKFTAPELPKDLNLKWDPALEAGFRKKAHEIGLNDAQFNELMKLDTDSKIASIQAHRAAQKTAQDAYAKQAQTHLSAIQSEWGPKFQENSALAVDTMTKMASADFMKLMEEARLPDGTPFRNHPVVAKQFFNWSEAVGEGGFIRGGTAAVPASPKGPLRLSKEVRESIGLK